MSLRLSLGLFAVSSSLLACGGDAGGKTDAGVQVNAPDPAYWGLADKSCFHFDDGSKNNYFTMSVTEDKTTVAGVTTYALSFKENGFIQHRDEWLEVTGESLVLRRRSMPADSTTTPATPNSYWIFKDPGPVYFGKNMREQQAIESKVTPNVSFGAMASQEVPMTFRVINNATETVRVGDKDEQATYLIVTGSRDDDGTGTADKYWFVPNVGIAKVQLSGSNTVLTLTSIEKGAATCAPN